MHGYRVFFDLFVHLFFHPSMNLLIHWFVHALAWFTLFIPCSFIAHWLTVFWLVHDTTTHFLIHWFTGSFACSFSNPLRIDSFMSLVCLAFKSCRTSKTNCSFFGAPHSFNFSWLARVTEISASHWVRIPIALVRNLRPGTAGRSWHLKLYLAYIPSFHLACTWHSCRTFFWPSIWGTCWHEYTTSNQVFVTGDVEVRPLVQKNHRLPKLKKR